MPKKPLSQNPSLARTHEPRLFLIRGQRVILDADLAQMYDVPTKRFNEAFKRNRERFPEDFAFQLTGEESIILRSQIATSSLESLSVTKNSKFEHGGRRYFPWVFTEHGAVMAANILTGEHATRMSVFVVRAFVRMREHIAANQAILKRLAEIDKSLLEHDSALRDIYRKLLPLLEPSPDSPPKGKLGFELGK
jgi:hypothetical protein